jgi:hypothetical protein
MPRICYRPYQPEEQTQSLIDSANEIINEYAAMDLAMTLRQLYYQFVARNLIESTMNSYNRLKAALNRARLAGMVDWDAIEDRTRDVQSNSHWDSPSDIVRASANQYEIDKWEGQPYMVEAWIEKVALIGVIEEPCGDLDITFCACKGYSSQSEMWRAGQRLVTAIRRRNQIPVILHFGDHDPSGMQMTADIEGRLRMFVEHHTDRHEIIVRRVALTMDQVEQYGPPDNTAKQTDPRYPDYVEAYGEACWELDALSPPDLVELVRTSVLEYRDEELWDARVAQEAEERGQLTRASRNWWRIERAFREMEDEEEEETPDIFDDLDEDEDEDDDE